MSLAGELANLPKASDTVAGFNALIEQTENPNRRRMLEINRDHYWGEVIWDVDAVMATLAPSGPLTYRFSGGAFSGMDGRRFTTRDEVRALYEGAAESGFLVGPMTEVHWTYGESALALDSKLYGVSLGKGLAGYAETLDPDQLYLLTWYGANYFPYTEDCAYMLGEWVYSSNVPLTIDPIDASMAKHLVS